MECEILSGETGSTGLKLQVIVADRVVDGDRVVRDQVISTLWGAVRSIVTVSLVEGVTGWEGVFDICIDPSPQAPFQAVTEDGDRIRLDGAEAWSRAAGFDATVAAAAAVIDRAFSDLAFAHTADLLEVSDNFMARTITATVRASVVPAFAIHLIDVLTAMGLTDCEELRSGQGRLARMFEQPGPACYDFLTVNFVDEGGQGQQRPLGVTEPSELAVWERILSSC